MTSFRSAALASHHDLDGFRCGHAELDDWLVRHARDSDARRTSRTHVWTARGADEVVAYFSFAPHLVVRGELSRRLAHRAPDRIPAILLALLALYEDLRGQGLGSHLLVDAFEICLAAADLIGGRFLVVDAIDERAHAWYEARGFAAVAGSKRLALKISTIAASLRR